ncbi:MAG: GWxTD domain-containing protein [Clostridiales bacterium]|nr:GWxTD domain-containing protein [Clostridiales bacterium]
MKTKILSLLLAASFTLVPSVSFSAKTELPERFKKWLDEEVVYIIGRLEREVFLKLTTDRERDLFIEGFWKQRDPTPGTPENEFRTEHYRRINYANHFFGRKSPRPGWKTDQGRIYIILGEPNDIQRLEGKTQTYAAEIWFYQGKTEEGLPPGFNLVFFQEGGVGEYKLYSPTRDGPQKLLTSYEGDPIDYMSAYEKLKEFEPELADASLSYIPGEASASIGRPSLASDLLVQRIETTPQRLIEEKYAQKFLQYKDIVEVEYTANYIGSDSLVKIVKEPSGLTFVHFSIEPERLSVGQYERKYYTTLKLNGSVTTPEGKIVFQFDRTISLDLDEAKMASISRQPLNIHDMFPLIPGTYNLSILVKNEVSKEFTSLEQTLLIPGDEAQFQMTPLILGYKVTRVDGWQKSLKPFRIGPCQVYSAPNRVFVKKDTLGLIFQVLGLEPGLKEKTEVRYTFLKDEESVRSFSRKLSEYPDFPVLLEEIALTDFVPAHYVVKATLIIDGQESLSASEAFDVTHFEAVSRPWVHSRILPDPSDPVYEYFVGSQLFNVGRIDEAVVHLERASRRKPESTDFALNLAQAYMVKRDFGKVGPLLGPFLDKEETPRYELLFLMGRAYQHMGELDKAIEVYDRVVSHYGTNTNLLNAIGECYFQKGDVKAALAVWEKSLEINADQPVIRQHVENLKGKK